jgi:hypothetical protein
MPSSVTSPAATPRYIRYLSCGGASTRKPLTRRKPCDTTIEWGEDGMPLHQFNAVFPDYGEDRKEVGQPQQIAELLAQVHQFQAAAGGFRRNI